MQIQLKAVCGAALILLASACSSTPQTRMITGDAQRVSYSWSEQRSDIPEITEMAMKHCAKFGATASLSADSASGEKGQTHTSIFACVELIGARA